MSNNPHLDRWLERYGSEFSGDVTVGIQTKSGELDSVQKLEMGETKSIENVTKIPRELTPYLGQIFEERDRLGQEYAKGSGETKWAIPAMETHMLEHPEAARWPTLNALLLPQAIENIRTRLATEGAQHETTDSNAGQASGAVAAPEAGTPAEGKT